MSGIYIKGMEMPKNCLDCPCCGDLEVYCKLGCEINLALAAMYVAHDCPLISVPDHERLINADALKEWVENWFRMNRNYHPYAKSNNIPITELYDILERMPTIIPVEESEI